jgi:hypothetical protein
MSRDLKSSTSKLLSYVFSIEANKWVIGEVDSNTLGCLCLKIETAKGVENWYQWEDDEKVKLFRGKDSGSTSS